MFKRVTFLALLSLASTGFAVNAEAFEMLTSPTRISQTGPDGDTSYDAYEPVSAYNAATGQTLVVWTGDASGDSNEIFGQVVDSNGQPVGSSFQISHMGSDGSAYSPNVAYNSTSQGFLVVWSSDSPDYEPVDENESDLADGEFEIWSQTISSSGTVVGENLRVSESAVFQSTHHNASSPTVAYSPTQNQYLVAWSSAIDGTPYGGTDDGYSSIFAARLDSDGKLIEYNRGAQMNTPQLKSTISVNSHIRAQSTYPAIAYNPNEDRFLVVYQLRRYTGSSSITLYNYNVYGTYVQAATDVTSPSQNDVGEYFQITNVGCSNSSDATCDDRYNTKYNAYLPKVIHSPSQNQDLVVWSAVMNGITADGENEIFGQFIFNSGDLNGSPFQISDVGPDGDSNYDAIQPNGVYNSYTKQFLITWAGDDNENGISEDEIRGQLLDETGNATGSDDFRISDTHLDTINPPYGNAVQKPSIVARSDSDQYSVFWGATDDTGGLASGEYEIFARIAGTPSLTTSEETTSESESEETYSEDSYYYDSYDDGYYYRNSSTTKKSSKFNLWIRKPQKQSSLRKGIVKIYVVCSSKCTASGSLKLTKPTKPKRAVKALKASFKGVKTGAYKRRLVKIKLGKKARREVKRLLRKRRNFTLQVTAKATSMSGSKKTVRQNIKIAS